MNSPLLCPLPFNQLYLHSSGEVYPCSFSQGKYSLGNIKKDKLADIWKGEKLAQFRKKHLNHSCQICNKSRTENQCHIHHESLRDDTLFQVKDLGPIKRLDIMIDSYCNLECIMCTNIYDENGGFEGDLFWKNSKEEIFPHLKEIELVGGEPLLVKNTFKLIDSITQVNKNSKWRITTNAHYKLSDKLKSYMDKIDIESVAISIDSLKEETFTKIRRGGQLNKVLTTLEHWRQYKDQRENPFIIDCNLVVQQDNAHELPSFISFCRKKNLKPYPIILRSPETYSLFNQKEDKILEILDFYLLSLRREYDIILFNVALKIMKEISPEQKLTRIELLNSLRA